MSPANHELSVEADEVRARARARAIASSLMSANLLRADIFRIMKA